ncbi:MAG TPA: glycosyltransferase [Solirubrobacteraceae bacterium]|nr:glycosyltransferase [Solirubrobacteraceae bacterium]
MRPRLRLVTPRRMRVVDVALFYGERGGGIRTYLEAKRRHARRTGAFEHHVVVPGRVRAGDGSDVHELPSWPLLRKNGYRVPAGTRALKATLRELRPDAVLLHDPFWASRGVVDVARRAGATVVAVHHGSSALDAAAIPGPRAVSQTVIRGWMRRTYAQADAVLAAVDPGNDAAGARTLPLRFGIDPAFRPRGEETRGDHVLYVGRLAREKGVFELLDAAARAEDPWPLVLVGTGPAERAVLGRARRLGIEQRLSVRPYVADRDALARAYAAARCVVMPGPLETFGLVALEAAASGARVVACEDAPAAVACGALANVFTAGDVDDLLAAIEAARAAPRDPMAAALLARRHEWGAAFDAELAELEALPR